MALFDITDLRAEALDFFIAEGVLVHKTSAIAFLEGKLTTTDGELIATATATARIFDPSTSANGHTR